MQLKRFKLFIKTLGKESDLAKAVESFDVFRKAGDDWLASDETLVESQDQKKSLDHILARGTHWRRRNGTSAFFPIANFQAVVVTKTSAPTHRTTRNRIQRILEEVADHANTAFDATYDGLTGLLNSRSLEKVIKDNVNSVAPTAEPADAEIKPTVSIALMALDLDHFKQINDSYGHDYGDIVLQCFAQRLEAQVNFILQKCGGTVRLEVGRSGGEEFMIVMSGDFAPERAKEMAERIRASVADRELPAQSEWDTLPSIRSNGSISLPHPSERKVTVSIGLSSLRSPKNDDAPAAVTDLRREADAALFRAKAGGRNSVRYFPEIRDRYGTVIEHHAETNIVIIDIGSQVNVRTGQEFHVYHPDFTGEKGFVYSDGRSKKRLGTYPRFSSGRIVVMDVQQEISFCTIAEKSLERFPPGSVLEQIPLGSISHLVSPEIKASVVGAAQISELDAYISTVLKRNAQPIAAVFSLRSLPSLEKNRGTAFVNKALASMFEAIRSTFPLPAKVCHIEPDKIAVAAQIDSKAKYATVVKKVTAAAELKMSNLIELTAGVFTPNEKQKSLAGDQSTLKPDKALDYARYAAVVAAKAESAIEFFTPATASMLISNHRSQKTHGEAMADYEALHQLGVEYSRFENQVALSAFQANNEEFALAHMQRAIALEPNFPVLKANLGYMQSWFDQHPAAHETFVRLHAEHPEYRLDDVYVGPEAVAAYAAFKRDASAVKLQTVKDLLSNAMSLASAGKTSARNSIPQLLAEISRIPTPATIEAEPQAEPKLSLNETWAKLLEAVGRVSPFSRSYLLEAQPVSLDEQSFLIGFATEFEDYLSLVDNDRNKALILAKLREMGLKVAEVKFTGI